MSYVAPAAEGANVSMEETAASIGTLSDAGIQGSRAGTSLRQIISSLQNPTDSTKQAMDDLGLSADDIDPKTSSLADVLKKLKDAGAGSADAMKLAGTRAGPALATLLEKGQDGLKKETKGLKESKGAAAKMADTMNDNLKGRLLELWSAIENVAIELYEKLEPYISAVVKGLTKFVRAAGNMSDHAQNIALAIGAIAAAIGPAILILSGLTGAFSGLISLLGVIATPIGAVVTGIVALSAGFATAYAKSEAFRNGVNKVVDIVKGFFAILQGNKGKAVSIFADAGLSPDTILSVTSKMETVREVIGKVTNGFKKAGMAVQGIFKLFTGDEGEAVSIFERMGLSPEQTKKVISIVNNVKETIKTMFDAVAQFASDIGAKISKFWDENGAQITEAVKTIFNFIKNNVSSAMNAVMKIMEFVWPAVQKAVEITWNEIKGIIDGSIDVILGIIKTFSALITGDWKGVWEGIKTILKGVWKVIKSILKAQASAVIAIVKPIWNKISKITKTIWGGIKKFFSSVWNGIKSVFHSVVDPIISFVRKSWNNIKKATQSTFNAAKKVVKTAWAGIKKFIINPVKAVIKFVRNKWNSIKKTTSNVFGSVKKTVNSVWKGIKKVFNTVVGSIVKFVKHRWSVMKNNTVKIFKGIKKVVKTVWAGIKKFIVNPVKAIIKFVAKHWNSMKKTTSKVFNSVKKTVNSIWKGIKKVFNTVVGSIIKFVKKHWNTMKSNTTKIFKAVKKFVKTAWAGIKKFIVTPVKAIIKFVSKHWDTIKKSTTTVFDAIKKTVNTVWGKIKKFIITPVRNVVKKVRDLWTTIKKNTVDKFNTIRKKVTDTWNTAKKNTVDLIGNLKDKAVKKFKDLASWVGTLPKAMGNAIKNKAKDAWDGLKKLAKSMVKKFKGLLGIHSPSTVFQDMGGNIIKGLVNGLGGGNIKDLGKKVLKDFGGGLFKSWGKIKDFFSGSSGGLKEMLSGMGKDEGGSVKAPKGKGVKRWTPQVKKALAKNNLSTGEGMVNKVLKQIQTESGGKANTVQSSAVKDINTAQGNPARGLMQTIPETFNANKHKGHGNIMNGYDNLLAALKYAKNKYGNNLSFLGKGHGYAQGGNITNDQFAWVGEHGPELMQLNAGSRVYSNRKSQKMTDGGGKAKSNGDNKPNITVNNHYTKANPTESELSRKQRQQLRRLGTEVSF